jgi:hypothetical protein
MNNYSFKYGMVVEMEAIPFSYIIPIKGIALTSSNDKVVSTYFKVEKYSEDDSDINYKIRFVPFDREHFGDEILYTSDAERMLRAGRIKIVSPLVGELLEYFSTTSQEQLEKDYKEIHSLIESSESSTIKKFLKEIKKFLKTK